MEILNDFIGADKVLDKQQNGSSGNNFRRIFHTIFSIDNLLVIPFLILIIAVMIVVCSGGLKEDSLACTTPTSITENITTTKENTTKENIETTTEPTTEKNTETSKAEETLITTEKETKTEVESITTTKESYETETNNGESSSSSSFGTFKSYTDYRCLSRSSAQWKLQEQAYTDENGLRKIGDAYLVAMGSYYGTTLGTKYIVTLSSGNSFTVMLCDFKDNRHTDSNNQVCLSNGSVIEFYVESDKMPSIVRQMGSVGALNQFSGSIVSIEKTA